jgi:zinc transport system permease protein
MMNIISVLQQAAGYSFMQKAMTAGILLAVSASLLGIFLVLRRFALISDGLAHVSFGAAALALTLGLSPLIIAVPAVIAASFIISRLTEKAQLYSDAAIGLTAAVSMAAGITIISLNRGFNSDIYSYLFGSILAVSTAELVLSALLCITVTAVMIFFFNELFMLSYDEDYARVSRLNIKLINIAVNIIQSLTIVIGVKIVGAVLVTSLIIFPAVTAMQLALSFRKMILFALITSVSSVILGLGTAFLFDTPAGAGIVLYNFLFFIVFFAANRILKIK